MEAKNGNFSVFLPPGILIEVYFFLVAHQKNFMIFEHNLPKFHQNLEKLLLNKILLRFRQIGKWKFSQLH